MNDALAILIGPGYIRLVGEVCTLVIHYEAAYQSAENRILAAEAVRMYRERKASGKAA